MPRGAPSIAKAVLATRPLLAVPAETGVPRLAKETTSPGLNGCTWWEVHGCGPRKRLHRDGCAQRLLRGEVPVQLPGQP